MTLNDIDFDDKKDWHKITDLENMFDISLDTKGYYMYNLNLTLYFNVDQSAFKEYICDHVMFWPLISYVLYSTTRLAWLLMKINNVKASQMFEPKSEGDVVRYLDRSTIESIVSDINSDRI